MVMISLFPRSPCPLYTPQLTNLETLSVELAPITPRAFQFIWMVLGDISGVVVGTKWSTRGCIFGLILHASEE
jgi:hypothetical protein